MIEYNVKWKKSAVKDLSSLPKDIISKIISIVDDLKNDPIPNNSIKLIGTTSSYRIRYSDYRIIYSVYKQDLIIEIVKIGHRKEIY